MRKKIRRNIWFTSDWHDRHHNAIGFTNRPFKNIYEMEEHFIKDYKRKVKPNDIVYFVGDIFWNTMKKSEIKRILDDLPGSKILIIGNHDKLSIRQAMRVGFDFACYEITIKLGKVWTRISHYPYRPTFWENLRFHVKEFFKTGKWNWKYVKHLKKRPRNFGGWLIHGHTHSFEKQKGKMLHVGVDAWNYGLVSESQLVQLMDLYENKKRK